MRPIDPIQRVAPVEQSVRLRTEADGRRQQKDSLTDELNLHEETAENHLEENISVIEVQNGLDIAI